MLRLCVLLSLVVAATVLVRAEGTPGRVANVGLIQMEDCLDLRIPQVSASTMQSSKQGLSLQGLGAMLGIGALTIMFFVPAALLSEMFMRRGEHPDSRDALLKRS